MRIKLLKLLDLAVGRLLVRVIARPVPGTVGPIGSILLIRPGGIGDAVVLVPVLEALHRRFPAAAIDVLAERRNSAVFELSGHLRRVYCYDRPRHLLSVVRRNYDVVVDTEQWYRLSAVIAWCVGSPVKIGFATNERQRLFTHAIHYSPDKRETESFVSLLSPLGVDGMPKASPWLSLPDRAVERADSLLGDLVGRPFVALFPGASIAEKRWETLRFREVAGTLQRSGLPVVVVGGRAEHAAGAVIIDGIPGALNLCGSTSLMETAAILKRAGILLSGDSGVLHLAVGVGTPTVSLFGPSSVAKWAPMGKEHTVLNKALVCTPCSRFGTIPSCPRHTECLSAISAEEVVSAVLALLSGRGNKSLDNIGPD